MIRVIVEMANPVTGRPERIAWAYIQNDGTGDRDLGNYDVELHVARRKRPWRKGRVTAFPRKKLGPWHLIHQAIECVLKSS